MFGGLKKRFWTDVDIVPVDGGYGVALDGRAVKTPAKSRLVMPSESLAGKVAEEWRAIAGEIDPAVLHYTRLCNASIDKVVPQYDDIVVMLAAYGETDLLCHRAESPDGLIKRQSEVWDPILRWARQSHRLLFTIVVGILPGDQPGESVEKLAEWLRKANNFELMALHDLTTISGSIVLARAVSDGFLDPQSAWAASRLDEVWQAEHWGQDSQAVQAARLKEAEFMRAADMLSMLREG